MLKSFAGVAFQKRLLFSDSFSGALHFFLVIRVFVFVVVWPVISLDVANALGLWTIPRSRAAVEPWAVLFSGFFTGYKTWQLVIEMLELIFPPSRMYILYTTTDKY